MCSYDSAEACEIVEFSLLRRPRFIFDINDTGLYGHDGVISSVNKAQGS